MSDTSYPAIRKLVNDATSEYEDGSSARCNICMNRAPRDNKKRHPNLSYTDRRAISHRDWCPVPAALAELERAEERERKALALVVGAQNAVAAERARCLKIVRECLPANETDRPWDHGIVSGMIARIEGKA